MFARTIIIDMLAYGLSRKQIAELANLTPASIGYILGKPEKKIHRQTLVGLLNAYAATVKAANARLRDSLERQRQAHDELQSLKWLYEPLG